MKFRGPLYSEGQTVWCVIAGEPFRPAMLKVKKYIVACVLDCGMYHVRHEDEPSIVYPVPENCLFPTEAGAHMWLADFAAVISDRERKWYKEWCSQSGQKENPKTKRKAKKCAT